MTPESSATASRSTGLAAPPRGRTSTPARQPAWSGQPEPADLVVGLLERISLAGWTVRQWAGRTVVAPALPVNRSQGWKLHVSATPANAALVLAACAPVLVETGTGFSFVATAAGLAELNGPRAPRARAGKFLTVHPATDELFRELARRLDEATAGYVGPAVLSDRPYQWGGVVHYRYGSFGGVGVPDDEGRYRRYLVDPEGNLVEDRCEPVFRPPAWAEPPFDPAPGRAASAVPGTPLRPTRSVGPNGPGWSVASMQLLGTSAAGPVTGPAGTAGSVGGGPGGPVGPVVPARSGGSTESEGPAGSGGPAWSAGAARLGESARFGAAARSGGPAGSGDPVRPAGAAGSTGAVGSTGTWGPVDPTGPAAVLIGGRYAVTGALRQANKGGVYRARDLRTGVEVLIKEARPYVGADAYDRDVRDLLGHEARVLRHLLLLGVTPRPLREFVQGDHRFLVEELLPGRPLSADLPNLPATDPDRPGRQHQPGWQQHLPGWRHLLGRLARLLGAVHPVGVVLRDLAPENVLLLPDGELRLVDLELAALRTGGPDDWSYLDLRLSGAAGFVAPEQWRGATPDPTADLFSLGVLALWLADRVSPAGLDVSGLPVRGLEEWVAALLEPSFGGPAVPPPLRRIVTGLLRADPVDRIGLDEVVALCVEASP